MSYLSHSGANVPGSESSRERKFQGAKVPGSERAKDYNRGFGIIMHNSPKVAANDLYTYESKLILRTINNF